MSRICYLPTQRLSLQFMSLDLSAGCGTWAEVAAGDDELEMADIEAVLANVLNKIAALVEAVVVVAAVVGPAAVSSAVILR